MLTVAVSVAGGIFAITSAVSSLAPYRVELSLAAIGLIALVNLRGVREAGFLFAIPTYGFIVALYIAIGTGIARCTVGTCPHAVAPNPLAAGAGAVGVLVLLRAFSSGASALTGVEAIANGVNAFKRPQSANAARTLAVLGTIAISLFLGVSWLAVHMHARPELHRFCALPDRARGVPGGERGVVHVLGRPGLHLRDPRARREHVLPGLPATLGAAREGSLRRAAVHEPR